MRSQSQKKMQPRVVAIVGPTASGKTAVAVQLALRYGGEIISADSRQVYKGLDIGTGKDKAEYRPLVRGRRVTVPVHGLDVVSPRSQYSVAKWQIMAHAAVEDIVGRGKTPIIVGGTGLYIDALLQGYQLPTVDQKKLLLVRRILDQKSLPQLLRLLQKRKPEIHATIDKQNRRRVQRALEVAMTTVPPAPNQPPVWSVLYLGLGADKQKRDQRIAARLVQRFSGIVREVRRLRVQGVSWKRFEELGLEYRFVSRYVRGQITKQECLEQLQQAIIQYARRQMTWFRRNRNIHWVTTSAQAQRLVKDFLRG